MYISFSLPFLFPDVLVFAVPSVRNKYIYKVNTGFATGLLKDGGDEAISPLMKTYHLTSDVPMMELDFKQVELDETGSGPEAMSDPEEEPGEPVATAASTESTTPPATAKARTVEAEVKTSSHRPEPREREDEIKIPRANSSPIPGPACHR